MRAEWLLVVLAVLAGCAGQPRPADPPLRKAALEAESDGAKRFERGDYAVAERRFREAERLFTSIDEPAGRLRNRLHQARAALALGRADAALALLEQAPPQLEAGMLRAQALLAAGRPEEALDGLGALSAECGATCAAGASLAILGGRAWLAKGEAAAAAAQAELALARLKDRDEPVETANAQRLLAAARLRGGDAAGALVAARAALDIDRRLAQPAKIAGDWLLLGDIHAASLPDTDAAEAYRRARDVAAAAGLDAIAIVATQALQSIGMEKK